jgi:diacylglycerol kinase family enzyme
LSFVNAVDVCVIFNPMAGRGRARRRLESLRRTLASRAEFQPTNGPGHAEELAHKAATCGIPIIGAAGGDGTVHEVANGLLMAERRESALAVFPVGSANDYAYSLGLQPEWWLCDDPLGRDRTVDVGVVRTPSGRQRYFVNGVGIGFNGAVTLESERIHWLQGVPLYTLALLRAWCFHYKYPMMAVTMDGTLRKVPTLALGVAIGQREGNFVLARNAQVDDGLFDYLHAGPVPRWEMLRYVPGMITGNLPTDHPALWMGRCRDVNVHSEAPLPVHVDGEMFSRPADGVCDLEVRVLPAALRIMGDQRKDR